MAGNKITRPEVIDDKVFDIGPDYGKSIQEAVEANVQWLASFKSLKEIIMEIAGLEKQFKASSNNRQFLQVKEREIQLNQRANAEIKEQERLSKALATAQAKFYSVQSGVNKELQQTRFETNELNKKAKEYAILSSKLSTEYQKQAVKLEQLRREYKDLAIRQKTSGDLTKEETIRMQALYKEAGKLDAALKKVDADVGQYQRNVGNYSSALGNLSNTAKSLVNAFGITSGAAIFAQIMKGAVENVKEFDSGLKNVQKTTGLTKPEIKALGEDIVDLSRKLQTVGTKSLLEYATVAGQLGVKGSANILAFTETLAKLETASDISGEEGGASIARLLTLVDGGVQNVSDFGDEIVKLGNNFAATENEILGNATAIAQNTGIYKLARQQVLAYAVATKAVGLESEVTGTAIGKTIGLIEKALRTGQGLEEITRLTGKSVLELQEQFKEDSGSVFNDLIKGLNEVDKAGGSVNEQLELLGIEEIRQQRVLGSLATAGFGTLEQAINDVADASGSLGTEFETASGKLENQFNRISIAWDNLILTIENGNGAIGKTTSLIFGQIANSLEVITFASENSSNAFKALFGIFTFNSSMVKEASSELKEHIRQQKISKTETDALTQAYIEQNGSLAPLNESLTEQVKLREKLNILTGSGAFEDPTQDFGAATETIKDLQEKIKGLNEELLDMDKNDIKGIRTKQEKIKTLQDELDAILGVTKGTRKAAKEQKDFTFETNKFINEAKIKFLEDFAKDEKRDFDTRQVALETLAELEVNLSEYIWKEKLKNVKKGSEEERYIIIQAEKEKQDIIRKFEADSDKLALDKIQANAETQKAVQEKLLNEALTRENEYFEQTKSQYKNLEEATEAHEKRVADIKKKYAIEALEAQIKQIELLLDTEEFSADERIRLEAKVAEYKKQISDLNTDTYKKEGKKRVLTEEEVAEKILQLSSELANALADIIHNLSEARVQNYEKEIEASDDKYDKLLENENLYEEDRKRIEDTKERAREEIERKIAREKRRQAILDKALAAVQIGINTAVNISKVTPNPILIALVAALGAAQLAAVAATPIPQYAKGTDDHKGGFALVGEERPEVIEEPGKEPYVVSKPTVLDLPKHTKVTPSIEEYERIRKAALLASVEISNNKLNDFQAGLAFDTNNEKMILEMQLTRKAISKIKQNVIFKGTKAPNLPYQFFRNTNIDWKA